MTHHYPDLGSAFDWSCRAGNWFKWCVISMEFLRSSLRRHLVGKPVIASPNVSCFLTTLIIMNKHEKKSQKRQLANAVKSTEKKKWTKPFGWSINNWINTDHITPPVCAFCCCCYKINTKSLSISTENIVLSESSCSCKSKLKLPCFIIVYCC